MHKKEVIKIPRRKRRHVRMLNESRIYKSKSSKNQNLISLDEFEAMRLCDFEEFSQIEAADQMNISRGTIQRLLISGRKKIIDSFLNNKEIMIDNNLYDNVLKNDDIINIIVPTNDLENIADYLVKAKYFNIYSLKNNKIDFIKKIDNNFNSGNIFVDILLENNINIVLSKQIGGNILKKLDAFKIKSYFNLSGNIIKAIKNNLVKGGEKNV